ncbi:MAG TPA: hypothetical protein VHA37_06295, partial [Candidatus Saccharimonadales bacterium]|nr:hypothetical protein [Candidatus Saccharimonadales bacterium]
PTRVTRVGRTIFASISDRFTGNISEQGAYIGLPAAMMVGAYFLQSTRQLQARALLIILSIVMIASLGPELQINGVRTGMLLPWSIATHLPLIKQALPSRFSMYVALITGLVMASWLVRATGRGRAGRFALAILACGAILPNPGLLKWSRLPTLSFFTGQSIADHLGPHPNVIILPYDYFEPAMYWQVQSGMAFTQSGGYLGYVPRAFAIHRWPVVGELLSRTPGPDFAQHLTAFCLAHHVDAVLATPGSSAALVDALRAMSWETYEAGGVRVFRVPAGPTSQHTGADPMSGQLAIRRTARALDDAWHN